MFVFFWPGQRIPTTLFKSGFPWNSVSEALSRCDAAPAQILLLSLCSRNFRLYPNPAATGPNVESSLHRFGRGLSHRGKPAFHRNAPSELKRQTIDQLARVRHNASTSANVYFRRGCFRRKGPQIKPQTPCTHPHSFRTTCRAVPNINKEANTLKHAIMLSKRINLRVMQRRP